MKKDPTTFLNTSFEKSLANLCLRPQVVLSPKAKDRKLTEGTCFKELNGNNSLGGYKWRKLDGKDLI